MKSEISVASRTNILVHVIPVEVLKLLCREIDPRNLVGVMVRRVKPIAVIDVYWWIRMSRAIARHFNFRPGQGDFMEDSPDREKIFFGVFRQNWSNERRLSLNWPSTAWSKCWLCILVVGKNDELEALRDRTQLLKCFRDISNFLNKLEPIVAIPTP